MATKSSRMLWAQKIARMESGRDVLSCARAPLSKSKSYTRVGFFGTVIGIDPSLRGTGIAVVRQLQNSEPEFLASQLVHNAPKLTQAECLREIFRAVEKLAKKFNVDAAAVEQTIYVQNNQTALILGSARGAAIAAAANFNVPVFEYPPLRIKQAVVGFGRASKEQVSKTVASILKIPALGFDESDAAAAALAHIFTHKDFV